ncbi:MAG: GMC family oxidoreductase N-terminal domain-containing protein [Planctomycetes bacterium]|nr:GMC family oxidoreductase N-terminal domain-containing protein [Planctomycetota bacterium]
MPEVTRYLTADVVVVGSGAGGGAVAARLAPLCAAGRRVLVLEQGARLTDDELTGREVEMARALYAQGGGVLTAERTLSLAMGCTLGGSTAVYTGTSLRPAARVIEAWGVPGLDHEDLSRRCASYEADNSVHLLPPEALNDNNRLFRAGCERLGWEAAQFPVNVKGCRGCGLCNLGCAAGAKQGTNRVQLPRAEGAGVEVVTRCEVLDLEAHQGQWLVRARVRPPAPGAAGVRSHWSAGEYVLRARAVVVAAGAVGSPALLLRSRLPARLPRLGRGFTCQPAVIVVAEHDRPITNSRGHPKSFYVDRAAEEGFLLETCMYFPFTTARSLTGFGPAHEALLRAFPRLQMILVLAIDPVDARNRVTVDRAGRPVVRYRFTPTVVERLAAGSRAAARIAFAAGARRVHVPVADPPLIEAADAGDPRAPEALAGRVRPDMFVEGRVAVSAAHLMGGCAMGRGPGDSVTDALGRVHGAPGLYVADASLFPAAAEINPYLTIMALADRVADAVLEDTSVAGAAR